MESSKNTDVLFESIPDFPNSFSSGSVIARLIDGLGFRFHWATKDLSEKDLTFKSDPTVRTIYELVGHIYNLLEQVKAGLDNNRYALPEPVYDIPFEELRRKSLNLIKELSDQVAVMGDKDLDQAQMHYKIGGEDMDFPFWYGINGPISDAIHHVGQVTQIRRVSGNPIDQEINVFFGKKVPHLSDSK